MFKAFLQRLNADKECTRRSIYEGEFPISNMPRLAGALASDEGVVKVNLAFDRDERGGKRLSGTLDAEVSLICQRCLDEVKVPLHADVDLGIVDHESAIPALSDGLEPLLAQDGQVVLRDVAEDELLLLIPLIPMHEDEGCSAELVALQESVREALTQEEEQAGEEVHADNPFAVLKSLKH